MAEQLTTPRELLGACLRQMLWIERQLADDVLPRLREQAHAPHLRAGFDRHLLETESHVSTVRDVLGDLHLPAEPEESPSFRGLVAEHEQLVGRVAEDDHLLRDLTIHVKLGLDVPKTLQAALGSLVGADFDLDFKIDRPNAVSAPS